MVEIKNLGLEGLNEKVFINIDKTVEKKYLGITKPVLPLYLLKN